MDMELTELAREIEAAFSLDAGLADRACRILERHAGQSVSPGDLESTDTVLGLFYRLRPGWEISIHGTSHAPNGHWRCSLRRSLARDNDAMIGLGRGPTLPHSLLAALLKTLAIDD